MLGGVDIAMITGQVAGGQEVQENISFAALETDRPGIAHDAQLGEIVRNNEAGGPLLFHILVERVEGQR